MSINTQDFVHPEAPTKTSFTDAEWRRAKKAAKRIRDRLAASCRHLIKAKDPAKPITRIYPTRDQVEEVNRKLREAQRIAAGYED